MNNMILILRNLQVLVAPSVLFIIINDDIIERYGIWCFPWPNELKFQYVYTLIMIDKVTAQAASN